MMFINRFIGKDRVMRKEKNINPAADEYEQHVAETGGDYSVKTSKYHRAIAKVLCVLAALVLWFYVASTNTAIEEKKFTGVPVTVINTEVIEENLGMSVISGNDYTVDLTLQGAKAELDRISLDDISAYVDVGEVAEAGEMALEIRTSVPAGVTVTNQSASLISVYIDKSIQTRVPVKVTQSSFVFEPYSIGTPEPSVDTVIVTGPAAELEKIDHALVALDLLDLGRIEKTVTTTGRPVLIDKNGETVNNAFIKLQTTELTVRVPVYTKKEVKLVPIYKYGYYDNANVTANVTPDSITVKGDPDELAEIDSIGLYIDETKINDSGTDRCYIDVPLGELDGFENISAHTSARVDFVHTNTETFKYTVRSISVNNPNNLKYVLGTSTIEIELRGTSVARSLLGDTENNIKASIDLSSIPAAAGYMSLPVNIEVVGISNLYPINAYEIGVSVK